MNAPLVYLNGEWLARDQARVSIDDRGLLFGHGVYEVVRYDAGMPFEMQRHVDRLRHSCDAVGLPFTDLSSLSDELVERNGLRDAKVYWQVTAGTAGPRAFFPLETPRATVLLAADAMPTLDPAADLRRLSAVTVPDERWGRCDVKTTMLLPAVMAVAHARRRGADVAIWHRQGMVTESCYANLMIVERGRVVTPPADRQILPGVTRAVILEQARQRGEPALEEPLTLERLMHAQEVFLTGTTLNITPVTAIDGHAIGRGDIGPVTRRWSEALLRRFERL